MDAKKTQLILITQATVGMILARPVHSQDNVPLCSFGTKLTDELIHQLMVRGIKRVLVQGKHFDTFHEISFAKRQVILDRLFSNVQHNSLMMDIKKIILDEVAKVR